MIACFAYKCLSCGDEFTKCRYWPEYEITQMYIPGIFVIVAYPATPFPLTVCKCGEFKSLRTLRGYILG